MRSKENILVISLYKIGNKGDEAILYTILTDLINQKIYNICSLGISKAGVLVNDDIKQKEIDEICKEVFENKSDRRKFNFRLFFNLHKFIYRIIKSDTIIFGGGHWIHDYSLISLSLVLLTASTGSFLRKKVVFYAVGIGPIKRKLSKILIGCMLKNVNLFLVRDIRSKEELINCGIDKRVIIKTIDPVVNMPIKKLSSIKEITKKNYLVFSPCAWGKMSNYYKRDKSFENHLVIQIEKILRYLSFRYEEILIVPTMMPEDYDFGSLFLNINSNIKIIDSNDYFSWEIQNIISNSKFLVSMRLHPIIFATNSAVPFICLNYDSKVKSYVDYYHLPSYVCLEYDSFINIEKFKIFFEKIENKSEDFKKIILKENLKLKKLEENNIINIERT